MNTLKIVQNLDFTMELICLKHAARKVSQTMDDSKKVYWMITCDIRSLILQ